METEPATETRFLFPRWINRLLLIVAGFIGIGIGGAAVMGGLVTDPNTLNVGYKPVQPVPFSHAIHAGQLRMDCRYCHNTVFDAAHAAIPPTATCINCHSPESEAGSGQANLAAVHSGSEKLAPIHKSWEEGRSMAWIRVHNLPEFVYFNHSAHVHAGVSCVTCHGRIDQMEVVYQAEPLSMGWCLECHRAPEEYLRPVEEVTTMGYSEMVRADEDTYQAYIAANLARIEAEGIKPPQNCSACHY